MPFRFEDCAIPVLWCGDDDNIPKRKSKDETYYYATGTRSQCVKKGYGAGKYETLREGLPKGSLQYIKYVGDKYESNFKKEGVRNLTELTTRIRSLDSTGIKRLLTKVFTQKGGKLDKRGYNSTLMYLYRNGIDSRILPSCHKINIID